MRTESEQGNEVMYNYAWLQLLQRTRFVGPLAVKKQFVDISLINYRACYNLNQS